MSDEPLGEWVIEATRRHRARNNTTKFPGYIKAYILAFLRVFHDKYQWFPTTKQIRIVFGYSQTNKPLQQLRELEDEGYVKLDARRCVVLEILREPYFVPRPDFAKEKINDYCRYFGVAPEVVASSPEILGMDSRRSSSD